jgi:hypothetical protein
MFATSFAYTLISSPRSLIPDLGFQWKCAPARRGRIQARTTVPIAMPALSHELLITGVEMVCYFCTAIGVAFTFLFAARI